MDIEMYGVSPSVTLRNLSVPSVSTEVPVGSQKIFTVAMLLFSVEPRSLIVYIVLWRLKINKKFKVILFSEVI